MLASHGYVTNGMLSKPQFVYHVIVKKLSCKTFFFYSTYVSIPYVKLTFETRPQRTKNNCLSGDNDFAYVLMV